MKKIISIFILLVMVSGCENGETREFLGIDNHAPDASKVRTYNDLVIPTDFNNLPKPQ